MDLQHEIYDYFKQKDNYIIIDWNARIYILKETAWYYFILLFRLSKMIEYRQEEREKKAKRINNNALQKIIKEKYDDGSINVFYNEILHDNEEGLQEIYEELINQESPKYPHDLRHDLHRSIVHTMALHEAFSSLSVNEPPLKILLLLQEKLYLLCTRAKNTFSIFQEEERLSDQQSRNAATSHFKIEDFKKHEKYPELEAMIKVYSDTPKEVREVNRLIGDILESKEFKRNRVTIRKYRHLLFEDIRSG